MIPLNRILLVDDDDVTNMIHSRVIRKSGCAREIDVVRDGREGLDLLRSDLVSGRPLPELVFLDINMPVMGGFEFLKRFGVLDISANVPLVIVMLSTSLLPADHARALADPNVHCLCDKPLHLEMLLKVVDVVHRQTGPPCSAG